MNSLLREITSCSRWLLVLLVGLLAETALAHPGREGRPALGTVLNPDGTVRTGAHGAFSTTGYVLGTAPNGQPVFRPAATRQVRRTAGVGDANWSTAFQGLADGVVTTMAVDGQGNVYVGGRFSTTGTVPANNIARWNGTTWSALGAGITGIAGAYYTGFGDMPVNALAVDAAGNVYAGGTFATAGTTAAANIARWNGSTWSTLGAGLKSSVRAMVVDGTGNLYAGGSFNTYNAVGTRTDSIIMKWSGAAWTNVAGFASSTTGYAQVTALAMDSQSNLYAGGSFYLPGGTFSTSIAKRTSTSWTSLDPNAGLNGFSSSNIHSLVIDAQNNLYASGGFGRQGQYSNVLKWNGTSWTALGTVPQYSSQRYASQYFALAVDGQGNVYAGSDVTSPGVVAPAGSVVRWNGMAWVAVATGTNSSVYALKADATGNLYAAGGAVTTGNPVASFVARYTAATSAWSALSTLAPAGGVSENIFALAADGRGNVYAGGDLTVVGNQAANHVARWDGTHWNTLGTGIPTNNSISAMVADGQGNLYVGGSDLYDAGGVAVSHVAKWDGTAWIALGTGLDNYAGSLVLDGQNNLYAAGSFTTAGGVAAQGVAKWDGAAWSALGAGIGGRVNGLAAYGTGNVYAGGEFTIAGSVAANHVAYWNGAAWATLGAGLPDTVSAVVVDGTGTLYAASNRLRASTGQTCVVSRWTGSAWVDLGPRMMGEMGTLVVDSQGNLFAGVFNPQGATSRSTAIVRWTGTAWTSLGTGTNGNVYALAPSGTGLYVGGYFTATGDNSVAMGNIGYYANAAVTATRPATPEEGYQLYPNPAQLTTTLHVPASSPRLPLTLTDTQGRVVRRYPAPTAPETALDLRGLPAGVYVLRCGASSQRLVVE